MRSKQDKREKSKRPLPSKAGVPKTQRQSAVIISCGNIFLHSEHITKADLGIRQIYVYKKIFKSLWIARIRGAFRTCDLQFLLRFSTNIHLPKKQRSWMSAWAVTCERPLPLRNSPNMDSIMSVYCAYTACCTPRKQNSRTSQWPSQRSDNGIKKTSQSSLLSMCRGKVQAIFLPLCIGYIVIKIAYQIKISRIQLLSV